jgi:hypothetical protein
MTIVRGLFLPTAITAILLLIGCSWFESPELYKSDPGRTVFRSPEQTGGETATPAPQKVPGESR